MVHPNPRSWMYQRSGPFSAFTVFMYLFGLAWMVVNLRVMSWFINLFRTAGGSAQQQGAVLPSAIRQQQSLVRRIGAMTFRRSFFQLWVLRAVAAFMVVMPWFGAMVVVAIGQEVSTCRRFCVASES